MIKMNWVCDEAWKGPFTQSVHFAGSAIGTFLFGVASDKWGRYPAFIWSNVILTVGGMVLPFCYDIYSFTVVRFIMGLTYTTFYFTIYLLCTNS